MCIDFFVTNLIHLTMTVRDIKSLYRGERLWLRVSSVNDQTVVGRVWGHLVSPGLRFGQMIQIPICDIGRLVYGSIKRGSTFRRRA